MTKPGQTIEFRISIAIGAALVVQTALALIWAGAAGERISQLERRANIHATLVERTVRLEEQVLHIQASLDRIESKIDYYNAEVEQ
jgi:hypothetical protein